MLFAPQLPAGFHYRDEFIPVAEELALVRSIAGIEFSTFEMRGAVAKRRVAFFGRSYDEAKGPERPIPAFLCSLRSRLAEWAEVEPEAFAMALINEYREATPIGWHRDAPQYEIVAGVSLLSPARMKLRPYLAPIRHRADAATARPRKTTHEIELQPRSAYLITGESRQDFEHSISPVHALRYSITFRTLRVPAVAHSAEVG